MGFNGVNIIKACFRDVDTNLPIKNEVFTYTSDISSIQKQNKDICFVITYLSKTSKNNLLSLITSYLILLYIKGKRVLNIFHC